MFINCLDIDNVGGGIGVEFTLPMENCCDDVQCTVLSLVTDQANRMTRPASQPEQLSTPNQNNIRQSEQFQLSVRPIRIYFPTVALHHFHCQVR